MASRPLLGHCTGPLLPGHCSLISGEGYPSLCLVGEVAGVVWHLQGSGLPRSLYGVQHTCYCPIFCGLVSHARSDWEGFLCARGWGAPPPCPRAVVSLVVVLSLDGGDRKHWGCRSSLGSWQHCHLILGSWHQGGRKRWGPSLCPAPSKTRLRVTGLTLLATAVEGWGLQGTRDGVRKARMW